MGSQSSPHVIIVPTGAPGHTIPFVHFAKYLAAHKVTISFVTSDRQNSEIKDSLGTLDYTSQGLPLRFLNLRDGNAHLSHRDFTMAVRDNSDEEERIMRLLEGLIIDLSSPDAQRLREVAPASPPLAILHDMFATSWCHKACDELFLEKHLLFVSPAAALAVMFQSKRLHEEGAIPITAENFESIISGIPGLPPIHAMNLPKSMKDPSFYKSMRLNHCRYAKSKVILCNTFYALEKPVLDAFRNEVLGTDGVETEHIFDIGPFLPDSHLSDDATPAQLAQEVKDPCLLFLNTQLPSSVIFISFGSSATVSSAPQLLDIAAGLEASNQPFLWLLRPPGTPGVSPAAGPPASISEFLPPGFEERTKGRGLCYSGWAPQMWILKHPAVGGFLSHCGWNSILESVCAGIPILTWPMGAEQFLNASFLVDSAKLGLGLQRAPVSKEGVANNVNAQLPVSKEEIERKVRSLMQGDEGRSVRENTGKMRLNALKTVAEGGSSRTNFEAYVQLLHQRVLSNSIQQEVKLQTL